MPIARDERWQSVGRIDEVSETIYAVQRFFGEDPGPSRSKYSFGGALPTLRAHVQGASLLADGDLRSDAYRKARDFVDALLVGIQERFSPTKGHTLVWASRSR